MKIDHIAIWVTDLEIVKSYYLKYFCAKCSDKYVNPRKKFSSYFLSFESGTRLEIMQMPSIAKRQYYSKEIMGFAHMSISVGSKENVYKVTELIRANGFLIYDEPRTTGDGYFESVVSDPDGNRIEITI